QAYAAVSPDGNTLAAQHGEDAKLWDLKTGRELATLHLADPDQAIEGFRFTEDGSRLLILYELAASGAFVLEVWNVLVPPPRLLQRIEFGPDCWIDYSADGRWFAWARQRNDHGTILDTSSLVKHHISMSDRPFFAPTGTRVAFYDDIEEPVSMVDW